MKNILKISTVLLVAAPLLTGCIKESFPKGGSPTADQVADNEAAIEALVGAMPAGMVTAGAIDSRQQTDFGIQSIALRTDFMCGDIAVMGAQIGYSHYNGYYMNQNQDSRFVFPAYFWQAYYKYIESANKVIRLIPGDASGESKHSLGYAYAFRAKYYLDLARLFEPKAPHAEDIVGGYSIKGIEGLTVPIVRETTTEEEAKHNPRATREDMYKFILEDLAKAEGFLADAPKQVSSMPTLGAVYGMYARAYLEMGAAGDAGAYEKAAEYARKAISESGCTLLTEQQWLDPTTAFNTHTSNNSWLWYLPVTSAQLAELYNAFAHICSEAIWGYGFYDYASIGIDRSLYESIGANDFRKRAFIDPQKWDYYQYPINVEPAADFMEKSDPYTSLKFRPVNGETMQWTVGALADFPLMRVEEMYFIEMEAVAQSNLGEAKKLLETFMASRMLKGGKYTCPASVTDLKSFQKEMMVQKRVEFWGEGIVMFDLKRMDIGFDRGYEGTNHPSVAALRCPNGRSPQWNIVITRGEFQNNTAITDELNNPDPTGKLRLAK